MGAPETVERFSEWLMQEFDLPGTIEALRDRDAEQAARMEELEATIQRLDARVGRLEEQLELTAGVDRPTESDPETRARDLRLALLREAEAYSDDASRGVAWDYNEVGRVLAQLGHGELAPPQLYRAMEWAWGERPDRVGAPDGFEETTIHNDDGAEVRAIRCVPASVPDALRAQVRGEAVNEINNENVGADSSAPGVSPSEVTETT